VRADQEWSSWEKARSVTVDIDHGKSYTRSRQWSHTAAFVVIGIAVSAASEPGCSGERDGHFGGRAILAGPDCGDAHCDGHLLAGVLVCPAHRGTAGGSTHRTRASPLIGPVGRSTRRRRRTMAASPETTDSRVASAAAGTALWAW